MLFPTGVQIPFLAQFTTSNSGAAGLTVTVAVSRINTDGSTASVTTGNATELANGVYFYLLSSASTGTAGYYICTFTTTGTADLKKIAALEIVGPAWVTAAGLAADSTYYTPTVAGRIDVAVSSRNSVAPDNTSIATILTRTDVATSTRASATDYTTARAAKLDNLDAAISTRSSHSAADVWAVGTRTLTSFGTLVADVTTAVWAAGSRTLTSAGSLATDVWAVLTSGLTTSGSIGAALVSGLARLSGATVTIADPVSSTGRLTLRAGYAYTSSRGNAPTWSLTTSADLSTATGYLRFVESDGTNATTAIAATITGSAGAWTVTADLAAADTTALLVGKALRYGVEARFGSGATPLLLASGDVTVQRTP